jgi:hypothetical protein
MGIRLALTFGGKFLRASGKTWLKKEKALESISQVEKNISSKKSELKAKQHSVVKEAWKKTQQKEVL